MRFRPLINGGFLLVGLLTACAGVPKDPLADKEIVAVSCVPEEVGLTPAGLETRETLAAVTDGPKRYTRLAADWARRVARMAETEAVVNGCR